MLLLIPSQRPPELLGPLQRPPELLEPSQIPSALLEGTDPTPTPPFNNTNSSLSSFSGSVDFSWG